MNHNFQIISRYHPILAIKEKLQIPFQIDSLSLLKLINDIFIFALVSNIPLQLSNYKCFKYILTFPFHKL